MSDSNPQLKTVGLNVSGRVQGVGFRYFVFSTANRLGVSGWVKNMPNGSVELQATAPADMMEQLIFAVANGPPGSHVDKVETLYGRTKETPAENSEGFKIVH